MPIVLSANGKTIGNAVSIPTPVHFTKLIEALEKATSIKILTPSFGAAANLSLKALVVDDSFPVRKYMEKKLPELNQFPTHLNFSADGEQAQQRIAEDEFDIVFHDVVMPGIDGYKVCY